MATDPRGEHIALIDTHAHLTFPQFEDDREAVCQRAWGEGLDYIITVGAGDGITGNRDALALAKSDKKIFATAGVHPHDADKFGKEWLSDLVSLMEEERVVAVGEAGLDYHHQHSSREAQAECFRAQLKLAHQYSKPIVIHDRDAHDDVWKIIQEEGIPQRGGVFHCFSGDLGFAEKVVEAGFFISFTGVITFPNARDLQGIASIIPLEKMVLETDCPYLAPQPFRGKRNEPAYIRFAAEMIAEIKELSLGDVSRMTTLNAKRLFGLPGADLEPRIAYRIRDSLYLNLTNQCNLACTFCPKFTDYEVKGHCLKLNREPDVEQVFQAMGHPEQYDEVVFCGYGEPTRRLELVKEVSQRMKSAGVKRIRLNTDGLASLVYGRNIPQELSHLMDAMSVSLNAPDASTYARICPSKYGEKAYHAVKQFILDAKACIPEVIATAVALPDLDIEACRRVAEQELGVPFKVRQYMSVG